MRETTDTSADFLITDAEQIGRALVGRDRRDINERISRPVLARVSFSRWRELFSWGARGCLVRARQTLRESLRIKEAPIRRGVIAPAAGRSLCRTEVARDVARGHQQG